MKNRLIAAFVLVALAAGLFFVFHQIIAHEKAPSMIRDKDGLISQDTALAIAERVNSGLDTRNHAVIGGPSSPEVMGNKLVWVFVVPIGDDTANIDSQGRVPIYVDAHTGEAEVGLLQY